MVFYLYFGDAVACEFCENPASARCNSGWDSPSCEDKDSPPSSMCDGCAWLDPVAGVWRCPACAEFYIKHDKAEALVAALEAAP